MTYLDIHGVSKIFTGRGRPYHALDGVDLEIEKGEVVCLIGHSGCGKSTLLNLVGGLELPTFGSLRLDGNPITGPGPDRGMVFQHHALLPWLSVFDNVGEVVHAVFPDDPVAKRRERVERYLRLVRLWDHRDKRPAQLSGGMKQRVSIARAFSVQPKVLLLDEPFGALDALTRGSLQDELIDLWQGDGGSETVIMVTHDVDEAIYLADRIVVLTNGPHSRVGEIVAVEIPRPREKRAMVHQPAYAEVKDRLLYLLTNAHVPAA